MPETITTTQPTGLPLRDSRSADAIAVRATVLYPAISAPGFDAWTCYVATSFGGQLWQTGLDDVNRSIAIDFASVDRIGAFITAIESNPGCSVQIGKAEAELC